jgi:flagellar hook-basal body complex protein FliE
MALAAVTGPALQALQAYRTTQGDGGATAPTSGFGDMLHSALKGVVDQGHAAEQQSMAAISGHGNLLDVVSAVSKAELSLQTTIAVRDRVVQAYQDIMRMPI